MLNRLFLFLTCLTFYTLTVTVNAGEVVMTSNGFARGKDPKFIPISLVKAKTADELFRAFKQSDIPFALTQRGCEARAMAMTRLADQRGVQMGHIYAEGDLWAKSPELGHPDKWRYHVASFVWVQGPKGKPRAMVLDPSLFTKPVTIEEWKARIEFKPSPHVDFKGNVSDWYFGSRFQLLPRYSNPGTKLKYDADDLTLMNKTNDQNRTYIRTPGTLPRELRRQPFSAQAIE